MAPPTEVISPTDGHPRKWQILTIMCGCLVLVVAGVSSLNLAIPSIIAALQPSATETLWIVDSYALVFAGLLLPAGALGDRYGRKGALLVGLGIFIAGALSSAWSGDPTQLIIARGSMGIGAALIMPATLSIIVSVFPVLEKPKAIAVWAGFAGAGAAIGIVGGGLLLEYFWWGSVFFINVPIALAAAGFIAVRVPTSKDENETPFDPVGSVLSIAGLGSLVYAIIEGGEVGWAEGSTIAWFVASAILLAAWVQWERRARHPMLDPALFRRLPFSLGSVALISGFAVMFGMFFILTQYFQFAQGHSPLAAGVRTLPFAATMVIVSPRSPLVTARIGARGAMTLGLIFQATGFFVLAQLEVDSPYILAAVGLVLAATGMGLLMPPASAAIVSSVPPSKAGVGSAWNDATREVGGALGIAVLGTLLSTGYRTSVQDTTAGLPPELADLAEEGIGGAFRVAAEAGTPELADAARNAFVDGLSLAYLVGSGVGVAAAVLVAARYPR
ncbi:MAG: MFS transporter, partial [Acidimicrobiia bacterium]|nr:MFS transporter [Acidimicrobiia bacterium]